MGQCCCTVRWTRRRTLHQVSHAAPAIAPSAYRLNMGKSPTDKLKLMAGNDHCADCGRLGPDWSAKNHGVIVCIRCAGVHRKLGTHISTVLSLVADNWDEESLNMVRKKKGNSAVNKVLEANLPATFSRASLLTDDVALERFIRSKYQSGVFRKEGSGQMVNTLHPAVSSSKIAMVEYVGLVFIELLAGHDLPLSSSCLGRAPYVVFSTSGQSAKTTPGQSNGRGDHVWTPPGKVSLNCKTTGSIVAVQLYSEAAFGSPQVLAVGGIQLFKGMPERSKHVVQLISTQGTAEEKQPTPNPGGPSLEVLVSLHIIT